MKQKAMRIYGAMVAVGLLVCSCSDEVPYKQSSPVSQTIPAGVALSEDVLFGIWTGTTESGSTNTNYFTEEYRLEFEDVESGAAVFSHTYTDGSSESEASVSDLEYTYTFDGKRVELTPGTDAASAGATKIIGVHVGDNKLRLYTENNNYCDTICTLVRTANPAPSVKSVNRTLPKAGEIVKITGRNLQFVSQIYLPLKEGGELEVTDFTYEDRAISFVLPEGEFAAGAIRLHSDKSGISCYTPSYMFCDNCIFFHNFSTFGTSAPYEGTEFEYTISTLSTLFSGAKAYSTSKLPEGHSLLNATCQMPDSVLSFFGDVPVELPIATGTDNKLGYLRFSSADRFRKAVESADGLYTTLTSTSDLAIQMDVYVESNGEPVWDTGYISYRLNKDQQSLTSTAVANVAGWTSGEPMDFSDGWLTFTIPLTSFEMATVTGSNTIGGLISSLQSSSLQTIFTFVNYTLDGNHPAKALNSFQFNIADMRLVSTAIPESVKD